MNNIETLHKIQQTLKELDEMPYGIIRSQKTIPPSIYHYEQLINALINFLLSIDHQNINITIDNIISIRDNQVRNLRLRKNNNFNTYGIDSEMEDISRLIHMYIDDLLN